VSTWRSGHDSGGIGGCTAGGHPHLEFFSGVISTCKIIRTSLIAGVLVTGNLATNSSGGTQEARTLNAGRSWKLGPAGQVSFLKAVRKEIVRCGGRRWKRRDLDRRRGQWGEEARMDVASGAIWIGCASWIGGPAWFGAADDGRRRASRPNDGAPAS
jgi:hypothetical protein